MKSSGAAQCLIQDVSILRCQAVENVKGLTWRYQFGINYCRSNLESWEWVSLLWKHVENGKNRGSNTKPHETTTF